jgi:hypothetical protein
MAKEKKDWYGAPVRHQKLQQRHAMNPRFEDGYSLGLHCLISRTFSFSGQLTIVVVK